MQKNKIKKNVGEIRIISGLFKGRKLAVLDIEGLRPTTDRVKETVFNWLMPYIVDARCLDCFAGSGSLGFEALSRQAKEVVFLEKDKLAANKINSNLTKLNVVNGTVFNLDCLTYLNNNQNNQTFDIVFLDPPFDLGLLNPCIELLSKNNWLAPGCLIYIESEINLIIDLPNNWQQLKSKQAGKVKYQLLSYN